MRHIIIIEDKATEAACGLRPILPCYDELYDPRIHSIEYRDNIIKAFKDSLPKSDIKQIKEAAYNDGWKDAKAKRRKKTWQDFFGGWK